MADKESKDRFLANKELHRVRQILSATNDTTLTLYSSAVQTFDFLPQLIRLMEAVRDGEDGAKGEIGATVCSGLVLLECSGCDLFTQQADELYQNFDKALAVMKELPGDLRMSPLLGGTD